MPFNGIYNLRDANEKVNLEPWQLAEIKKCTIDPIYFIRNYVYINTKDHGMQLMKTYPFRMRPSNVSRNIVLISIDGHVR